MTVHCIAPESSWGRVWDYQLILEIWSSIPVQVHCPSAPTAPDSGDCLTEGGQWTFGQWTNVQNPKTSLKFKYYDTVLMSKIQKHP